MTATGSALSTQQIMAWDSEYVMGTYARQPIVFVRGFRKLDFMMGMLR